MYKKKKSGLSGKEAADDVPSWAQGERPLTTENGRDFAKRLLDDKYGAGNYPTGPGSEFNKIKKWDDRAFESRAGGQQWRAFSCSSTCIHGKTASRMSNRSE